MVNIFARQIKYEYYGGNRCVYIDVNGLYHWSPKEKPIPVSSSLSFKQHAVFNYFISDDSKQDIATTAAHSKHIS